MKKEFSHVTVLLHESVDLLDVKKDGIYVDGTLGGGGHSELILQRLSQQGRLIGIDQDGDAIEASCKRLSTYNNVTFIRDNFKNVKQILQKQAIPAIDGAILDLGVSSHQFDSGERGFSFRYDVPLDMRMDKRQKLDAKTVINTYSEENLADILYRYGEEKLSRRIASMVCEKRAEHPIETTFELVDIIDRAYGRKRFDMDKHPATRTFQALRIEVNDELKLLEQALLDFFDCLNHGGKLAVITFHSLEDRIVKNTFKTLCTGCTCPPSFPVCVCHNVPKGRLVNRKIVSAGKEELQSNIRARSAKLRVIEKLI